MHKLISSWIGRLSVGKKLVLIYFLDLSAVLFVSGILINEKYIAIDFARKEIVGNQYTVAVRDALFAAVNVGGTRSDSIDRSSVVASAEEINRAELALGSDMSSAALSKQFSDVLLAMPTQIVPGKTPVAADPTNAIASGRALITRIGNQSNLILDPDLDSYYTMSLVVLRFPELLDILVDTRVQALKIPSSNAVERQALQTRFLILEGRLDAIITGMTSDYDEAFAASSPLLRAQLSKPQIQLLAALDRFRTANHALMGVADEASSNMQHEKAYRTALMALKGAWVATNVQLDRLVQERISLLFKRMWLHLGTAMGLLCVILTMVFFIAGNIARPIRALSQVAEAVRRSGNYSLRATWDSADEIGLLVRSFNLMLAQLDEHRLAQQEIAAQARATEAQRALVESIPIPLMVTSMTDNKVLHANQTANELLALDQFNPWQRGADDQVREKFFQTLQAQGHVDEFEMQWHTGDVQNWALLSARPLLYQGQEAVLTTFTPINQIKQLESRLELWAKVFEATSESIIVLSAEGEVLSTNRAFLEATRFAEADIVGRQPDFLCADSHDAAHFDYLLKLAAAKGSWQGEVWIKRRDGESYPAWLILNSVVDGRGDISHFIALSLDISEQKQKEAQIHHLAHHDVLTNLPNRSLCMERLRLAIQQATRNGYRVAVLFIDLDRFKIINDTLGHHVGDGLLQSVSRRLVDAVRAGDTVSRLGGDEFVVVLNGVASIDEIEHIVERRLIPFIRQPHDVDGAELNVSCSVGVSVFPDDAQEIDMLMRHADSAMYQAKKHGRNKTQFFTKEINAGMQARLSIENHLRNAVDHRELILHYQPRISATTGKVTGVESLVRWQHPSNGLLLPNAFIPIAEESGLIVPMGEWILREACRQHLEWRDAGLGAIPVSVNLSAIQLKDDSLVLLLDTVLKEYAVDPAQLEFEITESVLMENMQDTAKILEKFKSRGVALSIDDFGTGYSSLNYLHRLPIDTLKIDKSFVQDMLDDPNDLKIIKSIINLGHSLGLNVVAEGVEHEEEAKALRFAGCDNFQGYYFSHPLAPESLAGWLKNWRLAGR